MTNPGNHVDHENLIVQMAKHLNLIRDHEASAWLLECIADMYAWPAGCMHTRTGQKSATPLIAPLWDRAVWCSTCAPASRPPIGSIADRTCDRCGHVCAVTLGDKIYPAAVLAGMVLVVFGLCRDCLRRETAS